MPAPTPSTNGRLVWPSAAARVLADYILIAERRYARDLRAIVADRAARFGAGDEIVDGIRSCVGEVFNNACVHAAGSLTRTVLAKDVAAGRWVVEVLDDGPGMPVFPDEAPAIVAGAEAEGGYGLWVVKSLAAEAFPRTCGEWSGVVFTFVIEAAP
ncbi:ATP-binding protein [Embleya sp. NBC_00896]|uniref:ATP-binding protein n=1 Tax=Embleya sp. NBC_00896 TaxID=2975961 RepID=UPI00386D73EB|nr:ATP-binding protein [Embleya sp. NBC_00896]